MSRMRAAVSVFGCSRRDYGHFHGRLLLRRPLPPSTAKNSLDRSARLILHFGPRPCLTCMSRQACPGIGTAPSWRTSRRLGRGVVIAKRLFSDAKGKGLEPRPCQSSRRSRYSQASYAQTSTKPGDVCGIRAGKKKAKSAQMSDLGCFWQSTGVAASAAAASHVNGHSQANHAQKHQRRSMPDMGGASEAKT